MVFHLLDVSKDFFLISTVYHPRIFEPYLYTKTIWMSKQAFFRNTFLIMTTMILDNAHARRAG